MAWHHSSWGVHRTVNVPSSSPPPAPWVAPGDPSPAPGVGSVSPHAASTRISDRVRPTAPKRRIINRLLWIRHAPRTSTGGRARYHTRILPDHRGRARAELPASGTNGEVRGHAADYLAAVTALKQLPTNKSPCRPSSWS